MPKSTTPQNRTRLVETGHWGKGDIHLVGPLAEYVQSHASTAPRIKESLGARYEQILGNGFNVYRVPISAYDVVNLNGRIYPKALWERVVTDQRHLWEGSVGLADHPKDEEEGSFKDVATVWLDMSIDESTKKVWGDVVFVGEYGRLAEEIMRAGGRVGFSTSGYGEVEEKVVDGVKVNMVIAETYQIERPADLVINPSQRVWGTADMQVGQAKTTGGLPPVNPMDENPVFEGARRGQPNKMMREERKATMKPLYEEKVFRKNIEEFLAEAAQKPPTERVPFLEEVLSFFSEGNAPDLREQVSKKLEEAQKEVSDLVRAGMVLQEKLGNIAVKKTEKVLETLEETIQDDLQKTKKAYTTKIGAMRRAMAQLKKALKNQPSLRELLQVEKQLAILQTEKARLAALLEVYKKRITGDSRKLRTLSRSQNEVKAHQALAKDILKETVRQYEGRVKALRSNLLSTSKKCEELHRKLQKALVENTRLKKTLKGGRITESVVNTPWLQPSDPLKEHLSFQEPEVKKYYEDLVAGYGAKIIPYRSQFLKCKTLSEASALFHRLLEKIFPLKRPSVSDSHLDYENEEEYQKSAQAELRTALMEQKLPKGWV